MGVTLGDIARRVGCSTIAVSRALNDPETTHVGPELRNKIRETASELGYRKRKRRASSVLSKR